jgi:nucleoside phosphorylase
MLAISRDVFTVEDLQKSSAELKRFSSRDTQFLAGRCLLDAVEYLRVDPKLPGIFLQLVNAHAIRLLVGCLEKLKRLDIVKRIEPQVKTTCLQLLESRNERAPYFGDDFWDWAYTIEALMVVGNAYPNLYQHEGVLKTEANLYYKELLARLDTGLTFGGKNEWFGPAVPSAAHKILSQCRKYITANQGAFDRTLDKLKADALTLIDNGKYLGRAVVPGYLQWHYGQVVAEFPHDSQSQQTQIKDWSSLPTETHTPDRAFALARVIQGAHTVSDTTTRDRAISMLYDCERLSRPFGTGLIGDTVKGSLNVLEAIWPAVSSSDFGDVNEMLDSLLSMYKTANTVGVVLAIDREMEECKRQFRAVGAVVRDLEDGLLLVDHQKYRALVTIGKAIAGAQEATMRLIDEHDARWLFMVGIAGSLGKDVVMKRKGGPKATVFGGPVKGDVVVAACTAPFEIRDKVREGGAKSAPVPLRGLEWLMIPADPGLFIVGLQAARQLKAPKFKVHQGLIVTGTGIKDDRKEKDRVLKEWPGGLAVEEESYLFALTCALRGKPYMVVRGISDLAKGDKIKQQRTGSEDKDQRLAARNATTLLVRTIDLLSERWVAR